MARNALSNERYKLVGSYERLRRALLDQQQHLRLERALSYWVLPSDRRLPLAFLDRTLRDILSCSLDELLSTPGVGQKKIQGLLDLLRRVTKEAQEGAPQAAEPAEVTSAAKLAAPARASSRVHGPVVDPAAVSEALWSSWCDTVRRAGLQDELLGRVAPTLQQLPTVIWRTPLSTYSETTLGRIRRLPTHGEKRVQAILEVFATVHEAVSTSALHESLDLVLVPRFVPAVQRWVLRTLARNEFPTAAELHSAAAVPMLRQIEIDLGPQVATLAAGRLSVSSGAPSVKEQADAMGVTRARVYQLLEDCGRVMEVRWPEGRWLLAPLAGKLNAATPEALGLLHALRDLFYP